MTRYDADLNYAAGPYAGHRPIRRRNRRAALAFGASAVAVALFTGIIVAGFGGGESVVHSGTVPLIQADASPFKLRPDDPGGMDVPYQDKLVYQRLNPGPNRPTVERLLPPPEQPLPRPVVAPALPPVPPIPTPPAIAGIVPPPGATATVPRTVPEDEAIPPAAAVSITAIPMPLDDSMPDEDIGADDLGGYSPTDAPPPPPPPRPAAAKAPPTPAASSATLPAKPAVTATLPAKPAAAAASGGWRVQLASVRSEAEAENEWKRLAGRYAGSLAGLAPQITKADLGERGVYYRVRGGTVDEARARAICAELKSQNVGCVVVRP